MASFNVRVTLAMQEQALREQKILTACPNRDEAGNLVRGKVSKVLCSGCGAQRWDDGTPCKSIVDGMGKRCGQRVTRMPENEEW